MQHFLRKAFPQGMIGTPLDDLFLRPGCLVEWGAQEGTTMETFRVHFKDPNSGDPRYFLRSPGQEFLSRKSDERWKMRIPALKDATIDERQALLRMLQGVGSQ